MNRRKMMLALAACVVAPPAPTLAFATGGIVSRSRPYVIGEHCSQQWITGDRGPELFIPHNPGHSITIITVYPKPHFS